MDENGERDKEKVKLVVLLEAVKAVDFYLSHPAKELTPDMVGVFLLAGARDFLENQMKDFDMEEWEDYLDDTLPNKENSKEVALLVLERLEPLAEHFKGTGILEDDLIEQLEELKKHYKEA